MNIQTAYNTWAETYDTVLNKTRDLEAAAIRQLLADVPFAEVIELGCGMGKNTEWLAAQAAHVTAVDFSAEMLGKAQAKIVSANVRFQQADITRAWDFASRPVDLVTCSLTLEHIQDLGAVFRQAARALKPGGLFYIGELHPFKQYQGSKQDLILKLVCSSLSALCTTFPTSWPRARPAGFSAWRFMSGSTKMTAPRYREYWHYYFIIVPPF